MICLDTTFLVDFWRHRHSPEHPCGRFLAEHAAEVIAVAVAAAGEFLEGAAAVSEDRVQEALRFLGVFQLLPAGEQTALHYARATADMRRRKRLAGASKADLWIAAAALENGATLATQNVKHFADVLGLKITQY